MITRRTMAVGAAALAASPARAQGWTALPEAFARIERRHGGRLGAAVLDLATGQAVAHRGEERFPLTSTFKLPLAAAVLARVEAGQESLDRRIPFGREALVTWSPVTEGAAGGPGLTVEALAEACMTISDNTAANLLLDALGGPAALTAFLRGIGDAQSRLDRCETELNEARPGDPRDTTTPLAMLATMRALTLGEALSPASRARLLAWMRANRTGGPLLRASLPAGWAAGDRTGAGGFNSRSVVGLLWPPGGRPPILVTAYLTEGPAAMAARDAALAELGAAVVAAAA
nr:class A beta-lactamase [Roseococcus thiosulfatophilus]